MAATAHKDDKSKEELFDSPEVLEEKIDQLVAWIRESRHCIAFTGAGISTAAGIPDFRSGMGTKLGVGPGVWELRAQKKERSKKARTVGSTLCAIPTHTHMTLLEMHKAGLLKDLISQNTDGLHLRSGFPSEHLAELHGNSNLERCKGCGARYLRDFRCRRAGNKVHNHKTGRACDGCGRELVDSIVNFGENLPEDEWSKAERAARHADLCIAAGSSLTVTPAADLPEEVGRREGSRLVIINLQRTPLDRHASLRIHGMVDEVMSRVASKLALEVPVWRLRRYIEIGWGSKEQVIAKLGGRRGRLSSSTVCLQMDDTPCMAFVRGLDRDGTSFDLFDSVRLVRTSATHYRLSNGVKMSSAPPPDRRAAPSSSSCHSFLASGTPSQTLSFLATFRGHYNEPPILVTLRLPASPPDTLDSHLQELQFDPRNPAQGWIPTDARPLTDPAELPTTKTPTKTPSRRSPPKSKATVTEKDMEKAHKGMRSLAAEFAALEM